MSRGYGFSNYLPVQTRRRRTPNNEIAVKMKTPVRMKTDNHGLASPEKYRHGCTLCEKVFSDKRHLEDHYRSRHNAAKLKCDYCEKTFNSLRAFQKHQPLHTGIYPFHCSTCNQGFNLRSELEAHENQHLGRGYSCLNCNKVFYVEKDLAKHQEGCSKQWF